MGVKMSHKYVFRVAKSFVELFLFSLLLTGCDLLTNAKFMEKFARGGPPVKDSKSISEQGLGKLAKDAFPIACPRTMVPQTLSGAPCHRANIDKSNLDIAFICIPC